MKTITVPIEKISTDTCVRECIGDTQALVGSIKKFGVYQPFVINSEDQLQKNFRAFAAAKEAGLEEVPCLIIDLDTPLESIELQVSDNQLHQPYSRSEQVQIAKLLLPKYEQRAKDRQGTRTDLHSDKLAEGQSGEAKNQVADLFGTSRSTLDKAMAICDASEADPGNFADLQAKMDKTGKVNGLYKEVLLRQRRLENQARYSDAPNDDWVFNGDFREHIKRQDFIPDNSVGLIPTDGIYVREFLHLYEPLAEFGAAKLAPGSFLTTYYWGPDTDRVIEMMTKHLKLFWVCGVYMKQSKTYRSLNIRSHFKLILIFRKPPLNDTWWSPFEDVVSGEKSKDNFEWEQPVEESAHFIKALCPPGGIVVDPMAGSGTALVAAKQLGFPYRGIEIDADRYQMINGRLAETRSPQDEPEIAESKQEEEEVDEAA